MELQSSVSVTVSAFSTRSVHPGPVDARGPSARGREALRDEPPWFVLVSKDHGRGTREIRKQLPL